MEPCTQKHISQWESEKLSWFVRGVVQQMKTPCSCCCGGYGCPSASPGGTGSDVSPCLTCSPVGWSGWDCSRQSRSDPALTDRRIAILIGFFFFNFLPKKVPKAELLLLCPAAVQFKLWAFVEEEHRVHLPLIGSPGVTADRIWLNEGNLGKKTNREKNGYPLGMSALHKQQTHAQQCSGHCCFQFRLASGSLLLGRLTACFREP